MSSAPSRSEDPVGAALGAAASQLKDDIRALGVALPVVLIDGRSGAGKTTLTALLARQWPLASPAQVLALDSVYPGWDGMDAGVAHILDAVLTPRAEGRDGWWRGWDWARDEPAGQHRIAADRPLLIEGSGLLTPATARCADLTVWVESPYAARRERALDRDGETYRPHWERWAAQEDRHIARDRPAEWAMRVVTVP